MGRSNRDQTGRTLGRDRRRIGNYRVVMEVHVDYLSHTSYGTKQEIGRYGSLSVQLRIAD